MYNPDLEPRVHPKCRPMHQARFFGYAALFFRVMELHVHPNPEILDL